MRSLIAILLLMFGSFIALFGLLGLIYGEFHGRLYAAFELTVGVVMAIGGWQLFPMQHE